jgi:hypothetical protein
MRQCVKFARRAVESLSASRAVGLRIPCRFAFGCSECEFLVVFDCLLLCLSCVWWHYLGFLNRSSSE